MYPEDEIDQWLAPTGSDDDRPKKMPAASQSTEHQAASLRAEIPRSSLGIIFECVHVPNRYRLSACNSISFTALAPHNLDPGQNHGFPLAALQVAGGTPASDHGMGCLAPFPETRATQSRSAPNRQRGRRP